MSIRTSSDDFCRYATYYDVTGIETILPRADSLEKKRELYTWARKANPEDTLLYPPHCDHLPKSDQMWQGQIFNNLGLVNIAILIPKIIPKTFLGKVFGWVDGIRFHLLNDTPEGATTIRQVWEHNKHDLERKAKKSVTRPDAALMQKLKSTDSALGTLAPLERNLGEREDWFSDAVFAQQNFTGTNPTTITVITAVPKSHGDITLLEEFIQAAEAQKKTEVCEFLKSVPASELYVQDTRYFREAVGAAQKNDYSDIKSDKNSPKEYRYAVAAVSLYHLPPSGRLHPISIVIDYKKTMKDSVTVFNRHLTASPNWALLPGEETDWPWRYAKTCAQITDWLRHEIAIHLTNTHFIEEALIVATQRTFKWDHIIMRILYPHWYKTLSLNKAARDTLVPSVVADLVGFTVEQAHNFINHEYETFDFQGSYIPADLERRGFPTADLGSQKLHNYAYARNMAPLWDAIHVFVTDMIKLEYPTDESVAKDAALFDTWSSEVRDDDKGRLRSFPAEIRTLEQLISAVTMCIHIASPQHTAVNYLQHYYQDFVPAKPAALCTPPPHTLKDLQNIDEKKLLAALPINRPREWLLSSHLPYLLSFRVADKNSLAGYVTSLYHIYKDKRETEDRHAPKIAEAAARFYARLHDFDGEVARISADMDDTNLAYDVLDPDSTAVSILI